MNKDESHWKKLVEKTLSSEFKIKFWQYNRTLKNGRQICKDMNWVGGLQNWPFLLTISM